MTTDRLSDPDVRDAIDTLNGLEYPDDRTPEATALRRRILGLDVAITEDGSTSLDPIAYLAERRPEITDVYSAIEDE